MELLRPTLPDDEARTPLLDDAGRAMLRRLREHADAPRWTYAVGDRLGAADVEAVAAFGETLERARRTPDAARAAALAALAARLPHVPRLAGRVPRGWTLADLPTATRAELAQAPESFVPDDVPLDRLLVYRTAGTTGHPIAVPHHPLAVAAYLPLLETALARHGARVRKGPDAVAAALLSFQVRTYTYATVLSAWGGAGFAKLNLRPADWPRPGAAGRYLADLAPSVLTGEPVTFAELLATETRPATGALVSTSSALAPGLRDALAARFAAPVVDWYSTVETGPVAYGCVAGHGLHVLPHDVIVEVLAAPGERGEIAVSGGRNPYLPLVRYRTGDTARLDAGPCPCGDPAPRLVELEGRTAVRFEAADGTPVGTVDLSRLLRSFPLFLHRFEQGPGLACRLDVRPLPGATLDLVALEEALRALLGDVPLALRVDPTLDGKIVPYLRRAAPLP